MTKKKRQNQSGAFSLLLAIAITVLLAGAVGFVYHIRSAKPQFDPTSHETLVVDDHEAGISFSYPAGFQYIKENSGMVGLVASGEHFGTLTFADKSKQSYAPRGIPSFDILYPTYIIQYAVVKHPSKWVGFMKLPQKETLSVGDKSVTAYIEDAQDAYGSQYYYEGALVPAGAYDYIFEYLSENPQVTGDKYLDVFHRILATVKFSPPTQRITQSEAQTSLVSPIPAL